jgi:hypothetical protein
MKSGKYRSAHIVAIAFEERLDLSPRRLATPAAHSTSLVARLPSGSHAALLFELPERAGGFFQPLVAFTTPDFIDCALSHSVRYLSCIDEDWRIKPSASNTSNIV